MSFFQTHVGKIYPWVKVFFDDEDPRNTPVQVDLIDEETPILKDWLGDLKILYVVDIDNSFQVILKRDLPKEISDEQLHKIAVNNLNRNVEFKLVDTGFGGHGLIAGGDHEAGSICIPDIWNWVAKYLNDNLIVGIPAKDLVLFVPESDEDKIANLKIFIHEIFKDGERLLTRNIFKFNKETKDWAIIDTVN